MAQACQPRSASPFTMRIADQAAGLIMRKPVQLEPKEEGGEVDEYWTEWIKDVDGYGTDLDAFARRVVLNSLLLGHSAVLVDFPSTEPAENLLQERQLGLRPYFLEVRADQILGWRKEEDSPLAPINQIRISEYVTESVGMFGDRAVTRSGCLNAAPGQFGVRVKTDGPSTKTALQAFLSSPWRSLTAAR